MIRYIALLRAVNVGGKNKIMMSSLQNIFENHGYLNVVTYLNSGNIIFSSYETDEIELRNRINQLIKDHFDLDNPVFLIKQTSLKEILSQAPLWWGNKDKDIYHNIIFLLPSRTIETVTKYLGDPTNHLEQVYPFQEVIFWSFDRVQYTQCNWWKKTASSPVNEMITIRTGNTIKKLIEIL